MFFIKFDYILIMLLIMIDLFCFDIASGVKINKKYENTEKFL